MNTMEITKIVAGLCGALLIFLLIKWGVEIVYHTGGGHGGEDHAAYVIETEEEEDSEIAIDEGPSFVELVASADIAKGAKVFSKCKACHKLEDGANTTGPHLFGIIGRAAGSVGGFSYSGAITALGTDWNVDALNEFLIKPSAFAAGTKMNFPGLKKEGDRANLIAYLMTIGN